MWRRGGPCRRTAQPSRSPPLVCSQTVDRLNRDALVFEADWVLRYTIEKNPQIEFRDTM